MLKYYKSKGRSQSTGINAGSMADIAFLLLIFFLVSTQFNQEKVMKVKLPPWSDFEAIGSTSKAILNIKINAQGEVLLNNEQIAFENLVEKVKTFILSPTTKSGKIKTPGNGIISLQHDAKTPYGIYLKIYDQIQSAYSQVHQEKAISLFQTDWDQIETSEKNKILKNFPVKISEAEPFSNAKN